MRGLKVFFIVVVLPLVGCVSGAQFSAKGDYTTTDGFVYIINNDNSITITGYSGPAADIVIPAVIEGRQVTAIGPRAFIGLNRWGKTNIRATGLELPESIMTIGDEAFFFNSIYELVIPGSVRHIGNNAFAFSFNLKGLLIPENVTYIGNRAFADNNIERLVISNTLRHIGRNAFAAHCTHIIIKGDGLMLETKHGFFENFVKCYNEHGKAGGEYMPIVAYRSTGEEYLPKMIGGLSTSRHTNWGKL